MLTAMKHRTFLSFLKNPFTFSTFPYRETYVFRTRNIRFRMEKPMFPSWETKNLSNKSNFIPRGFILCFIASRKIRFARRKKE